MAGSHGKGYEDIPDFLRSPTVPTSPAPAYSALPHRDVEFHFAPLLDGRPGEIELETVDGKRFLVHQKVLEQETVFFQIYYGFVPVWRLNQCQLPAAAPGRLCDGALATGSASRARGGEGELDNLLCLPKIFASILRSPADSNGIPPQLQGREPGFPEAHEHASPSTDNAFSAPTSAPPPPPHTALAPKEVVAPTPTINPYTWAVPESAHVLEAFLSLIYPSGTFTARPDALLSDVQLTARVCRAALGYQSAKALNSARDKLASWIPESPVGVYATACFFKFGDLARLASMSAMGVPPEGWSSECRNLMGRRGRSALIHLRDTRLSALRKILERPTEQDEHSAGCVRRPMIEQVWNARRTAVIHDLKPESELLELLQVDLRGGHCGDCIVLLGQTIQSCLYAAKELPKSV